MREIGALCVFCASSPGKDPAHAAAARALGRILAESGVALVYGGGRVGLMGVLADAALAAGGRVVGVIPRHLVAWEVEHTGVSELVEVETMHERKYEMFTRSDAFAVLPGGIGTLDETFEVLSWKVLRLHDKPLVIVDGGGYWRALLALFDRMAEGGFAGPALKRAFEVVATVEDVLPAARRAAPSVAAPRPGLF